MDWQFEITDMQIWGGRSASRRAAGMLDSTLQPPWETLEGVLEADDDRSYAWEISTLGCYLDVGRLDEPEELAPYQPLATVAGFNLSVTESRVPVVLVDAPAFGPELLDLLRTSGPGFRPRWLYEMPTDDGEDGVSVAR